jgi:DNA-directed RNA polymerase specialized sigma subunit
VGEDLKKNEMKLFHDWRDKGSVKAFQELYVSMKPLLYKAAKNASYGSNLPESAHQIWAAQSFHDALRTYNPSAGAALQTHVFTAVSQKSKRLNYTFSNLGKQPEPRAAQVGLYQTEHGNLTAELGREPTPAEVADRLGWSVKNVGLIQNELQRDLSIDSGVETTPFIESSLDRAILDDIYYDLTPEEQAVYDYIYGLHGKPALRKPNGKIDFEAIAARSGYSPSKARALFVRIRTRAEKAFRR